MHPADQGAEAGTRLRGPLNCVQVRLGFPVTAVLEHRLLVESPIRRRIHGLRWGSAHSRRDMASPVVVGLVGASCRSFRRYSGCALLRKDRAPLLLGCFLCVNGGGQGRVALNHVDLESDGPIVGSRLLCLDHHRRFLINVHYVDRIDSLRLVAGPLLETRLNNCHGLHHSLFLRRGWICCLRRFLWRCDGSCWFLAGYWACVCTWFCRRGCHGWSGDVFDRS